MTASVNACNCVDDVSIDNPPNCGKTLPGAFTGLLIAPLSISPYVDNASVVAGVQTGNLTSAASDQRPDTAPIWKRAVPALFAAPGLRTSTRSFAGTVTRRPAIFDSPAPSWAKTAFVTRTATSTDIAASVWFWTTIGNSNRSPKFKKRGADALAIKANRAVIVDSFKPN